MKIKNLGTEQRNAKTANVDELEVREIIQIMNDEDKLLMERINNKLDDIEKVISKAVEVLQNGGKIIYAGAGTSGRLGVLDAVECWPTFSTTYEFQALIAGGEAAFIKAVENAEDSLTLCVEDLKEINLEARDLFIGIAASGRTPYVIGGINYAKEIGCATACICCNEESEIGKLVDNKIEIDCGAEIVTGSTRLKSGTAQKIILNMISTTSMIKYGKVYGNLMVDVKITNEKLFERACGIVMEITNCDYDLAKEQLLASEKNVKLACLRIITGSSIDECKQLLVESNNVLKTAINQANKGC